MLYEMIAVVCNTLLQKRAMLTRPGPRGQTAQN